MHNFNTLNKRFYSTPSYFYLSSLKLDNLTNSTTCKSTLCRV